jgi:hypothetical protein
MEKLTVIWLVKEFSVFYGNPEIRYFVHNSLLLDATLSQMNPLHTQSVSLNLIPFTRLSH